ncbi:MAG: hypothetical protein VZR06_04185 [Butyrivibrio sp.]|nr:hypothetical protein [Butyrivibrio sp.]
MKDEYIKAYERYYRVVEGACISLIDYFNKDDVVIWDKYSLFEYLHKEKIVEVFLGEKKYCFHGAGCTVMVHESPSIDWDFGCKSWWCGIDPYKMARTLKADEYENHEFYSGEYIRGICEKCCLEKTMFIYKNLYYINLLSLGVKELKKPAVYDKMIVKYKGKIKEFPKAKSIDKFLRKSIYVYSNIESLNDLYSLSFISEGKEVLNFVYKDIAYPENASKIMNEEIIKPHIVDFWNM